MDHDEPTQEASTRGQVKGNIEYRERIILRPGTIVEVTLQQTSPADAPAKTLATQIIKDPTAPPIPFVLEYDPAAIDERMSYSVRAKITRAERLLFTTDTHYPVLTRGAGNTVNLMLVAPPKPAKKPDATLTNTYWKLVAIEGNAYQHLAHNREPHMQFGVEGNTVSGFTGCNNLAGSFATDGDKLELKMAAQQRACLEGMDTEQLFLKALHRVNRYQIAGDSLALYENDSPVLRFNAVYLQ